ncbi:pentapeptide repeat-containing protein [Moorena producens]|uniref:pentapeptide repeat-containing protein n=1 Tax=Moorena producens TaxID=1155739 RepID=UPI003C7147E6
MKAQEVIRKYSQGERDFRRKNLRDQSFQWRNLSGADFSDADIRGANFKNAILTGTKFRQAKAGLQKPWTIVLLLVSWIASGLSGIVSLYGGVLLALIFNPFQGFEIPILLAIATIALFAVIRPKYIEITKDIGITFANGASAAAQCLSNGCGSYFLETLVFPFVLIFAIPFVLAFVLIFAILLVLALAAPVALAVALAGALARPIGLNVALGFVVVGYCAAIALSGAGALAAVLGGGFILVGAYLGWRALKGDPRDTWIRNQAIALAATGRKVTGSTSFENANLTDADFTGATLTGGTSFENANLTDADFTGAILKSTDLRKANLTRTCWRNTIKLDEARLDWTILANPAVRELLVSGNGENKSYINCNLRGANLIGANLNYANLKQADLREATLRGANLAWANLTQSQAVGTDFTDAYLTGSCLKGWYIDSTTSLTNVDCNCVFFNVKFQLEKLYSKGSREQGAGSSDAARSWEGSAAKGGSPHERLPWFPPLATASRREQETNINTIDLELLHNKSINAFHVILHNGVNIEAFREAFQDIMAGNPEITGDSIQAVEHQGNDILVTLVVPEATDKGKVEKQFLERYQARLEAGKQAALLEGKLAAETPLVQNISELIRAGFPSKQSSNPIKLNFWWRHKE